MAQMSLSTLYSGAGSSTALQLQPVCCRCFRVRANDLHVLGDQYSVKYRHVMPARGAYQKKLPKKLLRKNLSPVDQESSTSEYSNEVVEQVANDKKEGEFTEMDGGTIVNEQVYEEENGSPASDETQIPGTNVFTLAKQQQPNKAKPVHNPDPEDESFIDLVEDLMEKVQDAERNILMLNRARIESLENLEQMQRDKDDLQSQVKVFQLKLSEAETRLKATVEEKSKLKLLEQEIETLKKKLSEGNKLQNAFSQQDVDYIELSKNVEKLQIEAGKSDSLVMEIEQLTKENEMLEGKIKSLQDKLVDSKRKDEVIAQLKSEKEFMRKARSEAERKLALTEMDTLELAKLKLEKQVVRENLQKLEKKGRNTFGIDSQQAGDGSVESQTMKEKLEELQSQLLKFEAENDILKQVKTENEVLRGQIIILEQCLADSDAALRSQLEAYEAEVESFQNGIAQLKAEISVSPVVDDMPWEFWSNVLLSIDGWLLEKKLVSEDATTLRELAWQRDASIKNVFIANKDSTADDILFGLEELLRKKKRPGMHIVHVAAEMAPVAKVGGLGDVVTGLGKSLQKKGHLVEVILPKYDCMDYSRIKNLKVINMDLNSYFEGHTYKNKIWTGIVDGLPVYFIEPYHPAKLFWRGTVYGENDDFARFTYFSRAALEFVLQATKKPDIIHCHDWHTAAVAPLYWNIYVPQGLNSARIAFTCHNFEYQGTEFPKSLAHCGLDPQQLHRPDRMQDNFLHDRINLLKGAIVFSNIATTVSPTYAQEVQTVEEGKGLHLTLRAHSQKFVGILNGIDTEAWNPASDLLIDHQYNAEDIGGKAANKRSLRATLGLAGTTLDSERPIVGCITRLVPQKGVHLIRHAIYRTLEQGGQFVLLGSSPIQHIQSEFEAISQQFSNHPHVRLILKYDESLSHLIYAGADIFIVPSIFEPCGLTQMIAMRYGAIPVARRTGGLNDSVFDVDDEMIPWQRRNGFTFLGTTELDLNSALDRALNYYVERRLWWQELVRKAMQIDLSWNTSADQYAELYEQAITRARRSASS